MEVKYSEKYESLSNLEPGEVAVSKDRSSFFVASYQICALTKKNKKVVIDLNNLENQYTDKIDMSQPVHILSPGDKFVCVV